jgi:hypothetical protein
VTELRGAGKRRDHGLAPPSGQWLSVVVVVGADVDEGHAIGLEDEHDAVLARETRCGAAGKCAFEPMRAQRGRGGILLDQHHHLIDGSGEIGVAREEDRKTLLKSRRREDAPNALRTLRMSAATDGYSRTLPALYSRMLR